MLNSFGNYSNGWNVFSGRRIKDTCLHWMGAYFTYSSVIKWSMNFVRFVVKVWVLDMQEEAERFFLLVHYPDHCKTELFVGFPCQAEAQTFALSPAALLRLFLGCCIHDAVLYPLHHNVSPGQFISDNESSECWLHKIFSESIWFHEFVGFT